MHQETAIPRISALPAVGVLRVKLRLGVKAAAARQSGCTVAEEEESEAESRAARGASALSDIIAAPKLGVEKEKESAQRKICEGKRSAADRISEAMYEAAARRASDAARLGNPQQVDTHNKRLKTGLHATLKAVSQCL